jgi:hypothetical protein
MMLYHRTTERGRSGIEADGRICAMRYVAGRVAFTSSWAELPTRPDPWVMVVDVPDDVAAPWKAPADEGGSAHEYWLPVDVANAYPRRWVRWSAGKPEPAL